MKGSGKPKFNRTNISQNTGAMHSNKVKNTYNNSKNRNDKKALLDKLLKRTPQTSENNS